MKQADCPDGALLLDYVLGRLDDPQLEAVADHVDHCARCEAIAEGFDGATDSLIELLRASEARGPYEAESQLDAAIHAVAGDLLKKSASNWTAARLPEQFDRYRILDQLGSGGMGSVFLAWDDRLARQVALKIPHFFVQDRLKVRERFLREAKLAAQIEHPRICRIYDAGEFDGLCFLAMELIEGRTLETWTANEGKTFQEAARIVRIVAETMQELHDMRIVHRDLKPSNVIVRNNGEPVIMDFGLARVFDAPQEESRITSDGMLVGSPAYMAPEQAAGEVNVLPACDIYSLGAILFELLTGTIPFGGNVAQVLSGVLNDPPPASSSRCPHVPPQLDQICLKAMQKKADDRFASMAEFAVALRAFENKPILLPHVISPTPVVSDKISPHAPVDTSTTTVRLPKTAGSPAVSAENSMAAPKRRSSAMIVVALAGILLLTPVFLLSDRRQSTEQTHPTGETSPAQPTVGASRLEIDYPEDPSLNLFVDGLPLDIASIKNEPLWLRPGNHNYEVTRDGHSITGGKMNVKPGETNAPLKIRTRWPRKPEP